MQAIPIINKPIEPEYTCLLRRTGLILKLTAVHLKQVTAPSKRKKPPTVISLAARRKIFIQSFFFVAAKAIIRLLPALILPPTIFQPSDVTPAPVGSFSNTTAGVFVQDTWNMFSQTNAGNRYPVRPSYRLWKTLSCREFAVFHHFNIGGSGWVLEWDIKRSNPSLPQIKDYQVYQLQPIAPGGNRRANRLAPISSSTKKSLAMATVILFNPRFFFLTNINDPVIAEEAANGDVGIL